MENDLFQIVGMEYSETENIIDEQKNAKGKKKVYIKEKKPILSFVTLGVIILGCLLANVISLKDPSYLDLNHLNEAPSGSFWFGTDHLGRDLFSCIWHGGRVSLAIGFLATVISTSIAVVYGAVSGMAGDFVDTMMMRATEIILSIPTLLITIFIQAILGNTTWITIAFVIGITGWCSIAKVVRTEVRQLKESEYVVAAKSMGGGFFHVLWKHLLPNILPSIMFMVVMNVRGAIAAESTLSFIGLGLPIGVVSWGSMLSLAENALMTKSWWVIMIPGIFLVTLLLCLTNIGNYVRGSSNPTESNL